MQADLNKNYNLHFINCEISDYNLLKYCCKLYEETKEADENYGSIFLSLVPNIVKSGKNKCSIINYHIILQFQIYNDLKTFLFLINRAKSELESKQYLQLIGKDYNILNSLNIIFWLIGDCIGVTSGCCSLLFPISEINQLSGKNSSLNSINSIISESQIALLNLFQFMQIYQFYKCLAILSLLGNTNTSANGS